MFKFKNDPSCRVCNHNHYWSLYKTRILNCSNNDCNCTDKKWAPTDNLEYLEGLHESKREKIREI